ncbi:MAG: hypothetical protein QNJ63_04915 [Calothrix sp. MO_192.B10]|nr:hypothetical protein [Calothrix sp. MO_192.B10]
MQRQIANHQTEEVKKLPEVWDDWEEGSRAFWLEMDALVEMSDSLET